MKTALAFLFFPAASGVIIVLALIFADGNPWGRREIPMLEQLDAMGLADLDADPIYNADDFDAPDWQEAWEARLAEMYGGEDEVWTAAQALFPGADEDGDCLNCGLSKHVCLCETWTDCQIALNAPAAAGKPDAIAIPVVRQ